MKPSKPRAFTVPEVMVAVTMFSIMLVVIAYLLSDAGSSWRHVWGNQTAQVNLHRVQRYLERDFLSADKNFVLVFPSRSHFSSGAKDGGAMAFLTPRQDGTGAEVRSDDGFAFNQRNVLYYAVVPAGFCACPGSAGPDNLDGACPHKVLIRKTIDLPPRTTPRSRPDLTEEVLMLETELEAYLTQPQGLDCRSMLEEPNVSSAEIVASGVLYFKVRTGVETGVRNEVEVDVRALNLEEMQRIKRIGSDYLADSPSTVRLLLSL